MSGQPSLSKSWISTCGHLAGTMSPSPASRVISRKRGTPSFTPSLRKTRLRARTPCALITTRSSRPSRFRSPKATPHGQSSPSSGSMRERPREFRRLAIAIARLAEKEPVAVPDEKVRAPVFIHIRDREPEPEDILRQPGLARDVPELQAAHVAQQHRARRARELVLDDEQIEQPVAVVVEHADIARGEKRLRARAALRGDVHELARRRCGRAGCAAFCAERCGSWSRFPAFSSRCSRRRVRACRCCPDRRRPRRWRVRAWRCQGDRSLQPCTAHIAKQTIRHRPLRRRVFGVRAIAESADEQIDQPVAIEISPRAAVAHQPGERLVQSGGASHVPELQFRASGRERQTEEQQSPDNLDVWRADEEPLSAKVHFSRV